MPGGGHNSPRSIKSSLKRTTTKTRASTYVPATNRGCSSSMGRVVQTLTKQGATREGTLADADLGLHQHCDRNVGGWPCRCGQWRGVASILQGSVRQHSGCFPARQHLGHAQGEVIEGHDVDAVKLSGGPRQSAQARGAVTSVQWRGKAPKHVGSSLPKSLGGLLATGASYSYFSQRGHAGPAQLAVSRVGAASA